MRQLADLATMHLLLDIKQDAGRQEFDLDPFAVRRRGPRALEPPARTVADSIAAIVEGLYSPEREQPLGRPSNTARSPRPIREECRQAKPVIAESPGPIPGARAARRLVEKTGTCSVAPV